VAAGAGVSPLSEGGMTPGFGGGPGGVASGSADGRTGSDPDGRLTATGPLEPGPARQPASTAQVSTMAGNVARRLLN